MILLLSLFALTSCAETSDVKDEQAQISMIFEDYMDQGAEKWFLTEKNEYSVQAMMVSKETSFHNELEVTDYTVTDDGVSVILKGKLDEMWVSKLPKVTSAVYHSEGRYSRLGYGVLDHSVRLYSA